jgi:acyl carrier protein
MKEKIIEIMVNVLNVDIAILDNDLEIGEIQEWDSLHHMMIISGIEKEFGIKFQREELVDLENIGDIVSLVEDKVA